MLTIYDYLFYKYNFYPEIMTLDFGLEPYLAVKEKYPETIIILCFY